jgi:4-amino-4-deoxychorismate lyase
VRAALVNGHPVSDGTGAIDVRDRGLSYGDGVFETMALQNGRVRFLDAHLQRLATGCSRLGIKPPADSILRAEIAAIANSQQDGVVKIIVTRGAGGRGYRPTEGAAATRILTLHDAPRQTGEDIAVRWCDMRLSRNPALAGIKHLNRLEQVMAQSEWRDERIGEGLMLDYEGELVCGTQSNVFLVRNGELATPDLRYCGVHGIMRAAVITTARELKIPVHEEPLWPDDLDSATEVFVTNAVRGVRSVVALDERSWSPGSVARSIRDALAAHA